MLHLKEKYFLFILWTSFISCYWCTAENENVPLSGQYISCIPNPDISAWIDTTKTKWDVVLLCNIPTLSACSLISHLSETDLKEETNNLPSSCFQVITAFISLRVATTSNAKLKIMPGCLSDWINSQPSFSGGILCLVADRITEWKQRLQGTNRKANGVIIEKSLQCVVSFDIIMLCESTTFVCRGVQQFTVFTYKQNL